MKKLFLFSALCVFLMLRVNAQPPAGATTPPSRSASDVISLYSDAYTNVVGTDWFPNWGQSTIVTDVLAGADPVKKYENFNYQGVQFATAVNASSMSTLHVDIWTPNCTAFDFYLINTSPSLVEQKVTLNPTLSGWNSYDIALSQYSAVALNNIGQFKLVGTPFGSSTVYLDNIYFWKSSNTPTITGFSVPSKFVGDPSFNLSTPSSNSPGTFSYTSGNPSVATISGNTVTILGAGTSIITANQAAAGSYTAGSTTASLVVSYPPPTTAAPTPTRAASSVMSLFSGAYTDVAGTDFFPNWSQSTVVTEVMIAGNATKKYEYLNYQGIQFASPLNASNMTNLHMDIYTPNCTAFDVFLINSGGVEQSVTLNPTLAGWNSFDILLSQYTAINLSAIIQFKLVGTPFGTSTVYWDNLYFWKPANSPTITGFSVPAKVVGDAPFPLSTPTSNSTGAFTYVSANPSVATISGNTVTVVGVGTSVITATQAAAGAYGSASVNATLVVSFAPPTIASPTPPLRNAPDVISLFSNAYPNVTGTDWFPNWGQSTIVSDVNIAGNATKKYEFLNYQGIQFSSPVNASNMTHLHVDIWTPNCTAFDIFLINTSPSTVEQSVTLTPTLSGWNSYNINLSQYNTIALNNIGQIKLVGTPFGTSTVYLDNIYLYKNTNAPVISVTQPTCSVATGTITVLSNTSGLTFSRDGSDYTNTTGIFTGVPTGTHNVTSKTAGGTVSAIAIAVVNTQPVISVKPSAVTGIKNISNCDTLQTYSVLPVSGYTYKWTVTGTGNSVKSGQGTSSVVMVMKSAGTVAAYAVNACLTKSVASALAVIKVKPGTPGVIQQSFVPPVLAKTNVCLFTQSAVAVTGKPDTFRIKTVLYATNGYIWEAPKGSIVNKINDTTITVVFPDTITLSVASPRYIKVRSTSSCDTSLPSSLTLTRSVPTAPALIAKGFFPTVNPVTSVCALVGGGSETYKIRKIASATSYNWYLSLGTNANIVHLNAAGPNDTAITVTYGVGFTKDTIIVRSVNGCSSSVAKSLAVSAILAPPTPISITSSTGNFNACKSTSVQYSVVNTPPTSTQSSVAKYRWTIPANSVIASASADSSIINLQFLSTYVGGRLIVKAASACGIFSSNDTAALSPQTPSSISSSTSSYNACIGNSIVFTVVLPVAPALQAATNRYRWTLPAHTSITTTNADSSLITLNFLAGYVGGNLAVKGVSVCGVFSGSRIQALTHTGCGAGFRTNNPSTEEIVLGNVKTGDIKLYPNPNKGNFSLQVKTGLNENSPANIQVVDIFGRVVAQFAASNNAGTISKNISLNKLATGVYTVKYTVGSVSNSIRMVVE